MTIPVRTEPECLENFFREFELCCFCHQPTVTWTDLPDRTPGQQVACCKGCAEIFDPDVVPTKREWCDYHAEQRKIRERAGIRV